MMRHLILTTSLPDGDYRTHGKLSWHERLRLELALWLYLSVPRRETMGIRTWTGNYTYEEAAAHNLIKAFSGEVNNA